MDMESSGAQIMLGDVEKLDAQGITAYFKNWLVSVILNDSSNTDGTPGIMLYATTSASWSDNKIICARALNRAGTVYLPVHREVKENVEIATGNTGKVFLWAELTDVTLINDVNIRVIIETWGNFIEFNEASH